MILPAQKPDLTRLLLPYDTGQVRRTETGIETAYTRSRLSEHGIIRRNGQVAHHMQHMSAPYGKSVDCGYHRFG